MRIEELRRLWIDAGGSINKGREPYTTAAVMKEYDLLIFINELLENKVKEK